MRLLVLCCLFYFHAAYSQNMSAKKYSYLALGDSYTIGEMVNAKDNFPNQAVEILKAKGLLFDDARIIAKTGWTTDELNEGIDKAGIKGSFDFVSLLIGVNNQYRGRDAEEYAKEFEGLLNRALVFSGNHPQRVTVLSIPDWGVTPFAEGRDRAKIAREIDAFNAVNKRIAVKYKVHYIDITPGTREASTDALLLASDGLHPSGKDYRRWAEALATVIENELKK